jgi:hypothetical protein
VSPLLVYVVSNEKLVKMAFTYVCSDEKEADAVERILDRVGTYRFKIDLLLADHGFYNERVIRRACDLTTAVIPVQKKGERMNDKLATHRSYMTTYRMYKRSEREAQFPLAASIFYQNGDRKHGGGAWRAISAIACPHRSNAAIGNARR